MIVFMILFNKEVCMMQTQTLNIQELFILEKDLKKIFQNNLKEILCRLNYSGRLNEVLSIMGLNNLINEQKIINRYGKIVVIGYSNTKIAKFLAVAKELGFNKNRFEFCLDYNEAKSFNYTKMQYSTKYSVVLIGAIPHNVKNKGNFSSIITAMEYQEGYPPILRVGNNDLKLTKSSFETVLKSLLERKIISL